MTRYGERLYFLAPEVRWTLLIYIKIRENDPYVTRHHSCLESSRILHNTESENRKSPVPTLYQVGSSSRTKSHLQNKRKITKGRLS